MNKELTPLEELQFIRQFEISDDHRTLNDHVICRQSLDNIETELKEKEKQDLILNFLKEHIVFENGVVKADFQWVIDDKETEEAVREWLK